MPAESVYNWPNPNTGNYTNIRFYLHHPADVTVKIYNQLGDLVASFTKKGTAQADNEITWDLSAVESGVYFAEVAAAGGGMTERKIIKIAVIK